MSEPRLERGVCRLVIRQPEVEQRHFGAFTDGPGGAQQARCVLPVTELFTDIPAAFHGARGAANVAPGFAAAMEKVGWLETSESGVIFPKFDRWNSQGGKKRLLTARRQADFKRKSNALGNANGNASSVTNALPKGKERKEEIKPSLEASVRIEKESRRKDPDPLFDALAEVTGSGGSHVGKTRKELLSREPAFTAEDVRFFARDWRKLLRWACPIKHPVLTLAIIERHIHVIRQKRNRPVVQTSPVAEQMKRAEQAARDREQSLSGSKIVESLADALGVKK